MSETQARHCYQITSKELPSLEDAGGWSCPKVQYVLKTVGKVAAALAFVALMAGGGVLLLTRRRYPSIEYEVIAALKQYGSAQNTYWKARYSTVPANGGGLREYAVSYRLLGGAVAQQNRAGTKLTLIPAVFGDASINSGFQGYFFVDASVDLHTGKQIKLAHDYGLYAHACQYGKSGLNSFYIDTGGTVVMCDPGKQVPAGTENPGVPAKEWTVP